MFPSEQSVSADVIAARSRPTGDVSSTVTVAGYEYSVFELAQYAAQTVTTARITVSVVAMATTVIEEPDGTVHALESGNSASYTVDIAVGANSMDVWCGGTLLRVAITGDYEVIGGLPWALVDTLTMSDLTTTDPLDFDGGTLFPAGQYLVRYQGGAVDYDGGGGSPAENYVVHAGWGTVFGCGYEMGPRIVYNVATETQAPGNNSSYSTIAACEAANAGAYKIITTTSTNRIALYIKDCFPSDNAGAPYMYELFRAAAGP